MAATSGSGRAAGLNVTALFAGSVAGADSFADMAVPRTAGWADRCRCPGGPSQSAWHAWLIAVRVRLLSLSSAKYGRTVRARDESRGWASSCVRYE